MIRVLAENGLAEVALKLCEQIIHEKGTVVTQRHIAPVIEYVKVNHYRGGPVALALSLIDEVTEETNHMDPALGEALLALFATQPRPYITWHHSLYAASVYNELRNTQKAPTKRMLDSCILLAGTSNDAFSFFSAIPQPDFVSKKNLFITVSKLGDDEAADLLYEHHFHRSYVVERAGYRKFGAKDLKKFWIKDVLGRYCDGQTNVDLSDIASRIGRTALNSTSVGVGEVAHGITTDVLIKRINTKSKRYKSLVVISNKLRANFNLKKYEAPVKAASA